ncbi:MAG: hypothetical protein DMF60_02770 [Acidobacteria bacterium]|nr:MAG: hypothetical protein DMF60_02770 [Acidobacteriota bacterium]
MNLITCSYFAWSIIWRLSIAETIIEDDLRQKVNSSKPSRLEEKLKLNVADYYGRDHTGKEKAERASKRTAMPLAAPHDCEYLLLEMAV